MGLLFSRPKKKFIYKVLPNPLEFIEILILNLIKREESISGECINVIVKKKILHRL